MQAATSLVKTEQEVIVVNLRECSAARKAWRSAGMALILTGVVVAAGLGAQVPTPSRPGSPARQDRRAESARRPLPPIPDVADRVYETDVVRTLYEFVADNSYVARHLPCFCSCGQRHGHTSVETCYIKKRDPDGTLAWSDHAMQCTICMDVIRMGKAMHERGLSMDQIRSEVEKEYARFDRRTPTPWPPKDR